MIIEILFEYLTTLNTLNTLSVLNSLSTLNIRKAPFTASKDGRIESKSIIAIGVKGYITNDIYEQNVEWAIQKIYDIQTNNNLREALRIAVRNR